MSPSNQQVELAKPAKGKFSITLRNLSESPLLRLPQEIQDTIYAYAVGGHVVDTAITTTCACRPTTPDTKKTTSSKKSHAKKPGTKKSQAKEPSTKKFAENLPAIPAVKLVCRLISVEPESGVSSHFRDGDQYHCRCPKHSTCFHRMIVPDPSRCHNCVEPAEQLRSIFAEGLASGICRSIYYENISRKKKAQFQYKHNIFRFNCFQAIEQFKNVLSGKQLAAIRNVCFATTYPHLPVPNLAEIGIRGSFPKIRRLYLTPETSLFLGYEPSALRPNQKSILAAAVNNLGVRVADNAKLEIYVNDVLDGQAELTEARAIVLKKHSTGIQRFSRKGTISLATIE